MVLTLYSCFFLGFKGQHIQTALNTTSTCSFPTKVAVGQHVHSHPSLPAPAQSWCGTTPGKTKSTCLTFHQAFKGTEVGQDMLSAEHRHRRSPHFSPKATAPTPALDREGAQPSCPRELGGGLEPHRNRQECESVLQADLRPPHFPCSPLPSLL